MRPVSWGDVGRMRRGIEVVLMLGGAFCLALGLDLLRGPDDGLSLGLAALGLAALALGGTLNMLGGAKPRVSAPVAGPLATATLAFAAGEPPRIVSRDGDLDVAVDGHGIVRFKLTGRRGTDRLVCRSAREHTAYFNTLRRDREEAAIKLAGPMPPLVRLELWDGARLKEGA